MTILEAAAALQAKKISPVELTAACLHTIGQTNPKLNAFITVTAESAEKRAAQLERELMDGRYRGPLHGIPIALKDNFCTAGVRTTCGSKVFEDYVPEFDAAALERLERAGAILLGKTGLHELAYGITSNNPHFGAVRNPHALEFSPGGSSGGSGAAVAAGMVFLGMGTDTGGSIRIPASFCGMVGLKPTAGRVSRHGVLPLGFSLDHVGPITRSVRDAALTLEAIAGFDNRDDASSRRPVKAYLPGREASLRGLRAGVAQNYFNERIDPEVGAAVDRSVRLAESLGAEIVPVGVPDIEAMNAVARVILLAEASAWMEPYLSDRSLFGPDVLALLDQGRFLTATDYINAQRLRRQMMADFSRIWERVDCLFTASTPTAAPRIGQTTIEIAGETEDVRLATTRLVRVFNLLGLPALSMPCGMTESGLPVGLQIVGRAFEEDVILRVGAALEDARS